MAAITYTKKEIHGAPNVTMFSPKTQFSPYKPGGTISGICRDGWEAVEEAFRQNFAEGLEQGAQLCVMQGDDIVVDLCGSGFGTRTVPEGSSYNHDTLQCIYSTGKNIEAIVVALLVDGGSIRYDDPIAMHWPEFAQEGKEKVTVADVMRHDAKLPYFLDPRDNTKYRTLSFEDIEERTPVHRMLETSPMITFGGKEEGEEGRRTYHPVTRGFIVDGLLLRVDPEGRTIGQFFREEVLKPLGIEDQYFVGMTPREEEGKSIAIMESYPDAYSETVDFLPAASQQDAGGHPGVRALLRFADPTTDLQKSNMGMGWSDCTDAVNGNVGRYTEISSAYNLATARSMACVLSLFANGGMVGDVRLISASTARLALSGNQVKKDHTFGWKLGFTAGGLCPMDTVRHLVDDEDDDDPPPSSCGSSLSSSAPPAADYYFGTNYEGFYGWCGLGGSINVIHPQKKLSVSYVMNARCNHFIGGPRGNRIFAAIKQVIG